MTSSEDLSPEAKHLLRQAKGADRATRSEVSNSVQRFRQARARRPAWQHPRATSSRRATPWAVFVAVLSGTLGAYATVGQSLGLPVPGWWPEFTSLPATGENTAEAVRGATERRSDASRNQTRPEGDGVTSGSAATATPSETAELKRPKRTVSQPASVPSVGSVQAERVNATPLSVNANPSVVSPVASEAIAGPLAQEVQTITAARDALNSRDYAQAARHLDAHRLQFPKGALSEERQALSAICQCRQGQGTSAAAAYVARRSNSPLARRVATECALDAE